MQTATIQAGNWWAQPRGATASQWVQTYRSSLGARHRGLIVDEVKTLGASTLLEVGCHCGPNLVRLGQALPELQMLGVDISAEAVDAGRAWMAAEGLSGRVQLNAGRMPLITANVPDRSVDVVLSCYTLAYTAPQDLDAVLWEIGRLAASAVILAEPMAAQTEVLHQRGGYQEWAHAYTESLRWVGTLRGCRTRTVEVSPPVDHLNRILVIER